MLLKLFLPQIRSKMPFYGVAKGRVPGVYNTWDDCKAQVHQYSDPKFKKFSTENEAQAFVKQSDSGSSLNTNTCSNVTSKSNPQYKTGSILTKSQNLQKRPISQKKTPPVKFPHADNNKSRNLLKPLKSFKLSNVSKQPKPLKVPKVPKPTKVSKPRKPKEKCFSSDSESDELSEPNSKISKPRKTIKASSTEMETSNKSGSSVSKRNKRVKSTSSDTDELSEVSSIIVRPSKNTQSTMNKTGKLDKSNECCNCGKPKRLNQSSRSRFEKQQMNLECSDSDCSEIDVRHIKELSKLLKKRKIIKLDHELSSLSDSCESVECATVKSSKTKKTTKPSKRIAQKVFPICESTNSDSTEAEINPKQVLAKKQRKRKTTTSNSESSDPSNAENDNAGNSDVPADIDWVDWDCLPSDTDGNGQLASSEPLPSSMQFDISSSGYVRVYTDGACSKNGFHGAAAGIGVWFGDNHPLNVSAPVVGRATNNKAEIDAVRIAATQAKKAGVKKLEIMTDSKFVIQCCTEWMQKWASNGWRTASGQPVKNREELIALNKAMILLDVTWTHVRGHRGIHGNEMADQLARAGCMTYKC